MMSKRANRIMVFSAMLMLALLFFAQGCMKFRISDAKAREDFGKAGVPIRLKHYSVNGLVIHYAETGNENAPTLFFIHGSPGSWSAFSAYLKDSGLLRKYRLISIDRPGYGYSGFGRGISILLQTEMIGAMLKKLDNGKPMYIIGHSLGGPLCVAIAARYPATVSGIVLLAASVDPNEEKKEHWRPILKAAPMRWFVPGAFRPSNDELWYFKKDVQEMPAYLHAVSCPVTIVQGLRDSLVPPGNAYYAQKELTHSSKVTLMQLVDANHFIPWTRYNLVRDVLYGFGD